MEIRTAALGLSLTLLATCTPFAVPPAAMAASTGNTARQVGRLVSEEPTATTPSMMDGTVLSIAKVGSTIVVGGTFTTVRNPGSDVDIPRSNVVAFDARTGEVRAGFAPDPNGTVYKVLPAADGRSVYLGGAFTSLTHHGHPTPVSRLTEVRVTNGSRVKTFAPGTWDGQVRDLEVTGSRLWVAGKFTRVHGRKQKALATLDARTGKYSSTFKKKFAGLHRTGHAYDVTDVLSITTDPKNKRLVAIGDFTSVDGERRDQIAMFKIKKSSTRLANWGTQLFASSCDPKFDTTMTDTSFSPDGSFFAVSTTGGYGGGASLSAASGCDVVARFETNETGTQIRPTWTAYTGGDSTWSIEVTSSAIYVGGHQRWQNNPGGNNVAGQGAVERTGIAALDPVNGMPYAWNPTRLPRGVGVKDMLATSKGLYVGSDTTVFAGQTRYRLAFVPLTGGATIPSYRAAKLPGTVVTARSGSAEVLLRTFDGAKVARAAAGSSAWSGALSGGVGAFVLGGVLYVAHADGTFTGQTVSADGVVGPPRPVDAADELVAQSDWHGTDVPGLTSLFYAQGRIYYTLSGKNVLFSRGFEASDGVVGQLRSTSAPVSGVTYSNVRGAFVVGSRFYFATPSGKLFAARWHGVSPVPGQVSEVTGAGSGWASRVMFLAQG